jgi:N-methylhydantoinase A
VYFAGPGHLEAEVVRAEHAAPGTRTAGPAILEYPGTTVVVGPGQVAVIDDFGNTILS